MRVLVDADACPVKDIIVRRTVPVTGVTRRFDFIYLRVISDAICGKEGTTNEN